MYKRAYSESVVLSKNLYNKDSVKDTHHKLKTNEIIEKTETKLENVVVRIRKLDKNEKSTLHTDPNDRTALYFDKDFEIEKYNFDIVFDENDDNQTIFNKIGGHFIINNVCNGFKETIITYGQTGSGKTYTLFGSNKEYGIIYYFVHYLYKLCNSKNKNKKKAIYLSIYEILGDTLIDLISNLNEKNIEFYTEEYYLKTIRYSYKVVNIQNYDIAKKIIDSACLLRNVEATSQNMRSSRSHAIIQFFVNISDCTLHNGIETIKDYYGVLTLVDLVGCEREEFNTNKNEHRNDKTSSKFLNSSLTSLNKMLRKMQMGNLDESDKRQSVLCKVLFNYIQKTCGVCLIFCFNPKISQKSLTSSTLIMASDCKKIKSKRKQLIYVKSENKESFFKKIANDDSSKNGNNKEKEKKYEGSKWENYNTIKKNVENGKDKEEEMEKKHVENINNLVEIEENKYLRLENNCAIFLIYLNDDKQEDVINLLNKKKDNGKLNSLKKILCDIINEQVKEEKKRKNVLEQLKSDNLKLKNENDYWKKEAYNYHNKLKILNKNYLKMNEFLLKTLNASTNDNNTSSDYTTSLFSKLDEKKGINDERQKNQTRGKNDMNLSSHNNDDTINNDNDDNINNDDNNIDNNDNNIDNIHNNIDNIHNNNNYYYNNQVVNTYAQLKQKKQLVQNKSQHILNNSSSDILRTSDKGNSHNPTTYYNEDHLLLHKNNTQFIEEKNKQRKEYYKEVINNKGSNINKADDQTNNRIEDNLRNHILNNINNEKNYINDYTNNKSYQEEIPYPNKEDNKHRSNKMMLQNNMIKGEIYRKNIYEKYKENGVTNNMEIEMKNKKKINNLNSQNIQRNNSMKETTNMLSIDNINKKYYEQYKNISPENNTCIITDKLNLLQKKKDTTKNIIHPLSNNDNKMLTNITIDSLATKIKNRLLKSRSLSIAREHKI
ncbi:kinesin-like protein, putative [Plasmodium sp. gorilla clade G1]|nr:kinesin-like protein, putative [Plasmodium sp. gorilla clade G1]